MIIIILKFIEHHPHTMTMMMWLITTLVLWFGGVSAFFKRFRAQPKLEIQESASWVYIKKLSEYREHTDVVIAGFVLYVILINASNEKIVLRNFSLSFNNLSESSKKMKGIKIRRIPFPATPRLNIGKIKMPQPVWYTTSHGDDLDGISSSGAQGILEPKDKDVGYLLFASSTWGSYNPYVLNGFVHGTLAATLTSGKKLICKFKIRVNEDKKAIEDFCPKFCAHAEDETSWIGVEEI